jgi:tRNA-splicing ligase RtcB (3'-phosphate/5'-hydroxy nucleic acid ligase)
MNQLAPKLFSWASIIDEQSLTQATKTATMPFIHPHVALMPDVHWGMGCGVGTVLPTQGAIMPAAVGVDIGCGMIAVRTQITRAELAGKDLKELRVAIERAVPLSAGNYNNKIQETVITRIAALEFQAFEIGFDPDAVAPNWRLQLGTLGSGNHFIEVCEDEEGRVWLFLHSGSRGIGNKIAMHHIHVAQDYCKRHWIPLPDKDLAYLVEGTAEFDMYIEQLLWAQRFALLNREEMMERVINQFQRWSGFEVARTFEVNCHHNYTTEEQHFGRRVWLSRKGAIDAHAGVFGLIPGSMGDLSYVVEGLGNPMSMNSAPHGAGRAHGRKQAERLFKVEQLHEKMVGVEWNSEKAKVFLDEIPMAYKPIDQVMADAVDLVKVKHTLKQFVNIKGD